MSGEKAQVVCVEINMYHNIAGPPMVPPLDPPESETLQIWLKVILIISNHVIYHIQLSILGGVNDDGAHNYKDEPY